RPSAGSRSRRRRRRCRPRSGTSSRRARASPCRSAAPARSGCPCSSAGPRGPSSSPRCPRASSPSSEPARGSAGRWDSLGSVAVLVNRAFEALRRPHNWVQLAKFGAVGLSGHVVNLAVYTALLGIGPHGAAVVSFVVSAANNYWWNRHWTFAQAKGHFAYQGSRFFVVALAALAVNQLWLLVFLDWF